MSKSQLLITVHMLVGYPTAFLVAPLAMGAFLTPAVHRRWGKLYLYLMTALYLSGSVLTVTRGHWLSWGFGRNVAFNFFGYSMLLYAWRAIHLYRLEGPVRPARLDWALAGLLTMTVAALAGLAAVRDFPLRVLAVIGALLVVLEFRDLRAEFAPKRRLYDRHLRFILASYFYVLTVVSIVHLKDELDRNVRWLWPSVLGGVVIALGSRQQIGPFPRAKVLRGLVRAMLVLVVLFLGYVSWDLVQRGPVAGQETGPPPPP